MSSKNTFSETTTNRYALALYELANEYSDLENIENQSKSLLELLKQSMDFRLFVKDPTSEKNEQIKSIEIIAEKFNFSEIFSKFLSFLVFKRRFLFLEKILNSLGL